MFFSTILNTVINHYSNTHIKPFKSPLNTCKSLIGYAKQDISLTDLQTTKYHINELIEFIDAYTSKIILHAVHQKHSKNFIA